MADRAATATPPAIGEHRLLSDGRATALLRPDGEVDWWCAPDVDSPPVLWSLLDPAGAAARWVGARMAWRSQEPAGPTARTVLVTDESRIECWDGLLPGEDGATALVRLVRALDRPADVVHWTGVGGFDRPWGEWSATDPPAARLLDATIFVTGGSSLPAEGGLCTRLRAERGVWSAAVVSVHAPVPPDVDVLVQRLQEAEGVARAALRGARLPRHHPERAADALAVLRACTYQPTGAVVAAATTSLPEAPGGDRQFDYRFTWLRDASLAVSVASLLGQRPTAERYLDFVLRMTSETQVPSGPMTDVRGQTVPEEREVPGVAGWAGSTPVRVGNGAADQIQFDALGLLLEAVSVYLQTGGSLAAPLWRLVKETADRISQDDRRLSNGIWELRSARPLVDADIGRWLALDRAVWIARGWRPWTRRRAWKRARDEARDRVLSAITESGGLPQSYDQGNGDGGPAPADASALMAVVFGMLDARGDARAVRLVEATLARLDAWPYLYRYEPNTDDGFQGLEGAFIPVSWWAGAALAAVGRLDQARDRVDTMCARLPRLLSEEVDPERGESLGNVPLVWSHMEAARTMYLLDAAAVRQRFGALGLWLWRLGRYVRLRWAAPFGGRGLETGS